MTGAQLPAVLPLKRADVLVADFDTELVVLVPEERKAHRLDAGLSLILSSCDGVMPAAELIAEVAADTGDTHVDLERWLLNGLAELAALKVLVRSADDVAETLTTDEST